MLPESFNKCRSVASFLLGPVSAREMAILTKHTSVPKSDWRFLASYDGPEEEAEEFENIVRMKIDQAPEPEVLGTFQSPDEGLNWGYKVFLAKVDGYYIGWSQEVWLGEGETPAMAAPTEIHYSIAKVPHARSD